MEKVAIIGDPHLGKHCSDSFRREAIEYGQDAFFKEQLIPELTERGITKIIFTGDIHDHRTQLNIRVACRTRRLLKDVFRNFEIMIVQGNHDLFYKNSYEYSALELYEDIPNVTIFREKGKSVKLLGKECYFIPWIITEREKNFTAFLKKLAKRPSEEIENTLIVGHFELSGVKMEGNNMAVHGMDTKYLLNAAKLTLSGHYHGKSSTQLGSHKLVYVGSPYPLTFVNATDIHGYHIIDENLDCEFIENRVSPGFINVKDTDDFSKIKSLENQFVNIHYNGETTEEVFLALTKEIDSMKPLTKNYVPYNTRMNVEVDEVDDDSDELISTDMRHLSRLLLDSDRELKLDKDVIMNKITETLDFLNL